MGAARRIQTTVQANGKIEVVASDLPLGQPVDVIVQLRGDQQTQRRSIIDILAGCRGGLQFKTAADVDAYIRGERESWDR